MRGHPDDAELDELPPEECWELVRSRSVGRFAANRSRRSPLIEPVNYAVERGASIVFRSGAGEKLNAVTRGIVAIQVDEVDPIHHTGWSVVVEGRARWLYEEQDDAEVETWAPGDRPYVVQLTCSRISGRRIRLVRPDTDERGYR